MVNNLNFPKDGIAILELLEQTYFREVNLGQESLWDIAKATGSTVEAIMEANHLSETPAPDTMVLIPIP